MSGLIASVHPAPSDPPPQNGTQQVTGKNEQFVYVRVSAHPVDVTITPLGTPLEQAKYFNTLGTACMLAAADALNQHRKQAAS